MLAALINALKKTDRKAADCSCLILGAGAAGYAIAMILRDFGMGDIVVYDSQGALYKGRSERMNPYKERLSELTNKHDQKCPLKDAFRDKDVFIGVAQPQYGERGDDCRHGG